MRNLFQELRQRHVFKVAVAYAAIGWLIVQIGDVSTTSFEAPAWVMKMLIVFVLLGFPVALFLAWAYDLTPDGIRRTESSAPRRARSGSTINRFTTMALVAVVAWLTWDRLHGTSDPTSVVVDKSVAVLPFSDFSPDGDYGWFADGLTDEILNALARTADLRVASRTSSFQYRDTTAELPAVATELGVAHILEGSVRRSSDRLRVTAQLIRASDNTHIWSDTFDGTTADSISIQEQIALRIANALETAMDPAELERMVATGTHSVDAWEHYLRGQALQRGNESRMSDLLEHYDRAVAIDPEFSEAHMAIANLWWMHLNPSIGVRYDAPISDEEARQRLVDAIGAASLYARSSEIQARYDAFLALFELRLVDHLHLQQQIVDERQRHFSSAIDLLRASLIAGDSETARDAAKIARERFSASDQPSSLLQYYYMVDPAAAAEFARYALDRPSVSRIDLYQIHRSLLESGDAAEAARVLALYRQREATADFLAMAEIRQACAEGRADDADRIYTSLLESLEPGKQPASHWLLLMTLGRHKEAENVIRHLDEGAGLLSLSGFLSYTYFDPSPFPNLKALLDAQGLIRPPAAEVSWFCRR